MSRVAERISRSPFSGDSSYHGAQRHIPILPSTTTSVFSQADIMEATSPASTTMGPPGNSSPEMDHETTNNVNSQGDTGHVTNGASCGNLSAAAATSSQQPKVVQTAFIHKLYKYNNRYSYKEKFADSECSMLEDRSIQNLISWSSSNDSFVMSPSSEFSKVLA